jgi:YtcA family
MTAIAHKSMSNRGRKLCLALVALMMLTGCQSAPSFSIAGSFFPDWVFCCLLGIVVAVAAYRLFIALKMERAVQPAVLIYPCIALSCAVTLWLLMFD